MQNEQFPILILIGRPASGKSEIIHHLAQLPPDERRCTFHIGSLKVLDDFPMLWTWLEEDRILSERLGRPRLHTNSDGHFVHNDLWHLLIERISLEYRKLRVESPDLHDETTTIIEFSRGSEHGGYREAFSHLSDEILTQAGVIYVNVSFAESLRKNRLRYNPERPYSILEHGLSDESMTRLYLQDDWQELTAGQGDWIETGSHRVPYTVFENEDDVTTGKPRQLAERLQKTFDRLWALKTKG